LSQLKTASVTFREEWFRFTHQRLSGMSPWRWAILGDRRFLTPDLRLHTSFSRYAHCSKSGNFALRKYSSRRRGGVETEPLKLSKAPARQFQTTVCDLAGDDFLASYLLPECAFSTRAASAGSLGRVEKQVPTIVSGFLELEIDLSFQPSSAPWGKHPHLDHHLRAVFVNCTRPQLTFPVKGWFKGGPT